MSTPHATGNHINPLLLFMLLMLPWLPCQANEIKIHHNGLTLNANLLMAKDKDYQDGVVMVLHGFLGHNQMEIVETAQQSLLDIGRSSLAINLSLSVDNRYGFFDCDIDHRHVLDDALNEIQAWIDYLKSKGVNKIVLMSHSFGANQLMVYTSERPDPAITHLVFLAPKISGTFREGYEHRYGKSFDAALDKANELIKQGKGDQLMEYTDFLSCPQAHVTPNSFFSYYSAKQIDRYYSFPQFLSSVDVPLLITTGTADERQPDIAKHVRPYIDGKKIQLSVIEGSGHFFEDFNIQLAIKSVLRFLQQTQ